MLMMWSSERPWPLTWQAHRQLNFLRSCVIIHHTQLMLGHLQHKQHTYISSSTLLVVTAAPIQIPAYTAMVSPPASSIVSCKDMCNAARHSALLEQG